MNIKFSISGKPISVNHAYGQNRGGRRFLKVEGMAFKENLGWEAKTAMKKVKSKFKYPIKVCLSFYHNDKRKRDIDNGIKLCLDALTKICYEDDSEIIQLEVLKDYSDEPRIDFEIIQL